jgi:DNA repair exonuclease SbcCD ATPase subunit
LKAAKSAEIKAAQDKVFNKEEESAEALKKNEEAKETLSNMRAALEADTNFLAGLKKTCAVTDEDWEARSKMRADEIAAVSDTIAMLTGDDARDLMSKSLGFVQLRAQSQRNAVQRARAVQFLAEAGKRLKSPRVAYLATRMRFDPFGKLRSGIDGMVGSLGKEKEDEIVHKDDCVHDFNENDKQTTERNEHKTDVEQEINDLEVDIDRLNDEEKRLRQEIADSQIEMKKASENRETENKDFQETVADQRATQAILKKAVERLGEFYNKQALLQTGQPVPGAAAPPPPQGFGEYKKSGGGGAMALIENIIADSKGVERDAIKAEQDAQTAYE